MRINESYEQITVEQFNQLEKQIGTKIPSSYKSFLLENNGGYPEKRGFLYQVGKEQRRGIINRFLGIHSGKNNNLMRYLAMYKGQDLRVPYELLPIAHDPGGNLICIAIMGQNIGTIYFWDHDLEGDEGEEPDYSNVYFISDSFQNFLDQLQNLA